MELRRIGWELWDPIGLGRSEGGWIGRPFEDEYDRYLAQAAEMFANGCSDEEIIDYFFVVQSESIGIAPKQLDTVVHARLSRLVETLRTSLGA